jgi:hypothetical protein
VRVTGQPAGTAAAPLGGEAAQLDLGIERGLEPQAAFGDDGATGVVTTRSSSWWNFRRCKTCEHTFRRGDRVLVDPVRRTAQHLVPGLACGSAADADADGRGRATVSAASGRDRDDFAAGLLNTWPSAVTLTRIGPRDWRLPRPGSGRAAPTCLYCGHTFRPGEYVVVCPCRVSAGASPACGAAVHRDPAAGLPCWDNWQPGGTLSVCPITSARL